MRMTDRQAQDETRTQNTEAEAGEGHKPRCMNTDDGFRVGGVQYVYIWIGFGLRGMETLKSI